MLYAGGRKKDKVKLKDFCKDIILSWPEIADHMDAKFVTQNNSWEAFMLIIYTMVNF